MALRSPLPFGERAKSRTIESVSIRLSIAINPKINLKQKRGSKKPTLCFPIAASWKVG
jgi:hypothetical protein